MVWRSESLGDTRSRSSSARTSSATPRVLFRDLSDEAVETLAVVRNGSLPRVGSVASVVATTRSSAIQVDLIHRADLIRQWVAKIFFRALSGEVFRMRDVHDVSGPFARPSAHRLREMRDGVVRGLRRACRRQDFSRMVGSDSRAEQGPPQLIGFIHNAFQQAAR